MAEGVAIASQIASIISIVILIFLLVRTSSRAKAQEAFAEQVAGIRREFSESFQSARAEGAAAGQLQRRELAQSLASGFAQISQSFSTFGNTLHSSFDQFGAMQKERLELAVQRINEFGERNETKFSDMQQEATQGRTLLRQEISESLKEFREVLGQRLEQAADLQREKLDSLASDMRRQSSLNSEAHEKLRTTVDSRMNEFGEKTDGIFSAMQQDSLQGRTALRQEIGESLKEFREVLGQRLDQSAEAQRERLENVTSEMRRQSSLNSEGQEKLRATVEGRLNDLRTENSQKLDEMRNTVDEKLQGTLEQRLGESFKRVDDQLRMVHESVGKMQDLAVGVGDLKRLFGNVKLRGGWAEVSLGNLLEQVFTVEQYAKNVAIDPQSDERVEFAIKLPGLGDDKPCWLPIDAKFPVEDYERLLHASEKGDSEGVDAALRGLETRIRKEAATICKKYVRPPYSTDFGIMFLPTEGLYAEVIRRPGLVDDLQREYQIVVAGPTVLMAILSSLRMGFKTLAIQQKSGEVWKVLGSAKTEFSKFGQVLEKVKKRIDDASSSLEKDVMVRTRAIERTLKGVELLPEHDPENVALSLPIVDLAAEPTNEISEADQSSND